MHVFASRYALPLALLLSACENGAPPATGGAADVSVSAGVDLPPPFEVTVFPNQDATADVAVETVVDFNAPCVANEDCSSGYCVQSPDGYICSQSCFDECPSGFICKQAAGSGTDISFLCVPDVQKLCEPCFNDSQCFGGFCDEVGDEGRRFCVAACGSDGVCPEGYACRDEAGATATEARCWPVTDSCTCGPEFAGAQRTCTEVTASGTCNGVETCDLAAGWSGCTASTPGVEVCDGVDNDCNGLADDGLPPTRDCEVTGDGGTCSGLERCAGSVGWVCDAPTPSVEVCDFKDNDCNGKVDDSFIDASGQYTTLQHCGGCGNGCVGKYANAKVVACDASGASPLCIVAECQANYFLASKFQCILPPNAVCKPCASDADCYGNDCIDVLGSTVCAPKCGGDDECGEGNTCQASHCLPENGSCDCDAETEGAKKSCATENGLGKCFGYSTCSATAGWSACDAAPAAQESCDGSDDDCNGIIDDDLVRPDCEQQKGVCAGSLKQCGGGAGWLPCGTSVYPATYETNEQACDNLDNDCDGQTDETIPGPACAKSLGVCAGVKTACSSGAFPACNYGAQYQGTDETLCDGLDNDCNGLTDDVDSDGDGFIGAGCGGPDCNDSEETIYPGHVEDCATNADDDCSGLANDRDADHDGFRALACGGNDCDDDNPIIHLGAVEVCGNQKDDDCDGTADNRDIDQDGVVDKGCLGGTDCSDNNPLVGPGQAEICGDGVDNDCDTKAENKDADGDSYIDVACGGNDCNDAVGTAHPGGLEVCSNGLDDDCNGSVDDLDFDNDGVVATACGGADCDDKNSARSPLVIENCSTPLDEDCSGVPNDKDTDRDTYLDKACGGTDCDDSNVGIHLGALEVCGNGKDDDCSGTSEDKDFDNDGSVAAACGGGDCNDNNPLMRPGQPEICGDGVDNDCNTKVDDKDKDGDLHVDMACGGNDCNDEVATAYLGAPELCGNGKDDNCDGTVDNLDFDKDGAIALACGGNDCDDQNAGKSPILKEKCNTALDDDCSGTANDKDADGDTYLDIACGGQDCDDAKPLVHPSALEVCGNGQDDDCSGVKDDKDFDNDGAVAVACGGTDCNDLSPVVYAGAPEICGDGVDNDCDAKSENKDVDGDGFIDVVCGGDDCNDNAAAARPNGVEVCGDTLDNDCNGSVNDRDADDDNYIDPLCGGTDCNDGQVTVYPGAPELCDTFDNDCNTVKDDKDDDGDGHRDLACGGDDCDDDDVYIHPGAPEVCGDTGHLDEDCSGKDGDKDADKDTYRDSGAKCLAGGTDCDDDDALVNPGATEIYDTKDTNCNGVVDEGLVPAGTIVVSEMMIDPSAVLDASGEWFEVTNVGSLPVNLASFTFKDKTPTNPNSFTIPPGARIVVAAGATAVLCLNADSSVNGGVDCDYDYDNFQLANTSDEVVVMLSTVEMDQVVYAATWPITTGVSTSLDPNQLSVGGNNASSSWCITPTGAINTLPKGDRGTPGRINPSCTGKPAVTSVAPSNGVDNGGDTVLIAGSGFLAANAVSIGGTACQAFSVLSDNEIQCVTPPGSVGDKAVVVTKGAQTGTLTSGYRYTGEAVAKIDYCAVQFPATLDEEAGKPSPLVFGRVHSPGVTEPAGAPAGVIGQVGYGPSGADPRNVGGWSWFPAYYNTICGGEPCGPNDEFFGTVTAGVKGTYAYAYRFSDDGGLNFIYCDVKPGTADGFQTSKLGVLTVF